VRVALVRHGHAGRKDEWDRPDRLRPLDQRGHGQAERLVDLLAPLKPTRVISSPYKRCLQTVAPLAKEFRLEVEQSPFLVPETGDLAYDLIRELTAPRSPSGVVVCTHGEVMGAVLRRMAAEGNLELERKPPGLKGCAWVLDVRRGKLVEARYLAPAR
jgi:8-oxo-(d)GTP phosphatase